MSGLVRPRIGIPSIPEETANQLTHGLGLLLSLGGAAVLISSAREHSDRMQFVGCCVYAASLVALYVPRRCRTASPPRGRGNSSACSIRSAFFS